MLPGGTVRKGMPLVRRGEAWDGAKLKTGMRFGMGGPGIGVSRARLEG